MNRFKRYRHTPRGRYTRHKANAKRRGVEFDISFDDWYQIWRLSLYYGIKGYAMCRYQDAGAYRVGKRLHRLGAAQLHGPQSQVRDSGACGCATSHPEQ